MKNDWFCFLSKLLQNSGFIPIIPGFNPVPQKLWVFCNSRFTLQFTFPLAKKNHDKIENTSVVSQKVRVKADPVLIAEDNAIVLRVIKQFLEQAGYAVILTIVGKAGLGALKTNSVSWALLDIGLPELWC